MSKKRIHLVSAVNAANISKTGNTYTIRDVCGAVDDIVMNRRLYPADQLKAGIKSLEGKPAPAGHPKNSKGQHISAANGEALATAWIGAYCTNARHDGGRTLTDIVVNGDMAQATEQGKKLVARLDAAIAGTNADPIHVSTGLNLIEVVANGESRGKKYTSIATNLQYDHLAILLDEPGAGTPEQGVGMFLNSEGIEDEIETITVNQEPEDRRYEGAIGWLRGLFANAEISFDQIYEGLRVELPKNSWVREVFGTYAVWSDEAGKLWRQDYHVALSGSVAWVGQPVEVVRQVSYEPITNTQEVDIVKEQIIAALNAAGIKTEGMDDSQALAAYNSLVKKPGDEKLTAANSRIAELETCPTCCCHRGFGCSSHWRVERGERDLPQMNFKQKLIATIGATAAAAVVPLVAKYEGTVLRTYRDPIGIITACTGHTGPELRMGQTFTRQQCQDMLYQDLVQHADALGCITQPLTDGQRAAFLSFAFNVGEAAFCKSTLVRKANAGDVHGACAELSRWTYAAGKQLPGLVQRRAAERQMCEGGLA